ncbi:MAG TPA: HAD-IIIA family hydrolase [Longimicrobium sp.]|jgi:HAD superfamily hydrolase (TIGR01662 family)|uniref:HAD-IIIA family hydrolase n=1 Tax=Longimicrobium sp. TaxID=2029185 RepID=UPI002ED7D602
MTDDPSIRLYIFDADDTLRRTLVPGKPCPHRPGEWELLPGVRERLSAMPWHTLHLGIASNQDQVAYGHMTAEMCRSLFVDLIREAVGRDVPEACIRFCPHALEVDCGCRKPAPGMLMDIMGHFEAGADETLFVGNAPSDKEAARAAGVRFAWAWDFFGW